MKEFKINEFLSLKLVSGKTHAYVNGELFRQCMTLIIEVPVEDIPQFDSHDSIDAVAERFYTLDDKKKYSIPPEEEFIGHLATTPSFKTLFQGF